MPTFVVERHNWRRVGSDAWVRLPGENVVATFAEQEGADAELLEREAHARRVVGHPFRCGASLRELTTLPDVVFLDWLQDEGIEPPDPDPDGRWPWRVWAELFHTEWTANQLAHVWEGCNRARFHRVRERSADPLHCVVRVRWTPLVNYANYEPLTEGGTPCGLWHDRANAERDREEKQRLAADEVAGGMEMVGEAAMLLDPRRRVAAAEPFAEAPPPTPADVRAVTHCEVVEVERGDAAAQPLGTRAFVVLRLGWDSTDDPDDDPGHFDHDCYDYDPNAPKGGAVVRAFRSREDAERLRDELEAEYRSFANPFRFDLPTLPGPDDNHGRLHTAFTELGLLPPAIPEIMSHDYIPRRLMYAAWWDRHSNHFTPEQLTALWELVSGVRFHEVREVSVGDGQALLPRRQRTLHLVRATNWIPDGGPNSNPHRILGAFADRARAEAARDEADRQARTNRTPLPMWRDDSGRNNWEDLSSWSLGEMRRHFVEHGLIRESEAADFVLHSCWWEDNRDRLRPAQVTAFWEVMDRVRLFEVLQLETEVAS